MQKGIKVVINESHIHIAMVNAQVKVDFLENSKGGHYLVHAGFKFWVKRRRNERSYWNCVNRQCPAKAVTINNIPANIGRNYNHPADSIGLTAEAFVNNIKKTL